MTSSQFGGGGTLTNRSQDGFDLFHPGVMVDDLKEMMDFTRDGPSTSSLPWSRNNRQEEPPPKQKRRRHGPPMTVCLNCHLHKLKCDKKRPCLHCSRRKRKCMYKDRTEAAEGGVDSEAYTSLDAIALSSPSNENLESTAAAAATATTTTTTTTSSSSTTSSPTNRALLARQESNTHSSISNDEDWSTESTFSDTHEELRRDTSQRFNRFTIMTKQRQDLFFGDVVNVQGVTPTSEYASQTWFDHLLTMFGPNKTSGRRMVASLLDRALQPTHHYWFELYHRPTIRRQMIREEERHRLNPAIAFALLAMALRQRGSDEATTYGYGSGTVTLIPSQVFTPPRSADDLSERLKTEAEKYLNQAILTADKATGNWLQIAQAATILMQLEMELSPTYLRYLYLAAIFFRAPSLQLALDQEAKTNFGVRFHKGPLTKPPISLSVQRSSITMEVAARLRLLPLWVGSRLGVAFPNIEFHQSDFKEIDVQDAYAFAPWPDEEVFKGDSKEAHANNIRSRIVGLSILSTGLGARFMPYGLDYSKPDEELQKCLRILDDSEFILDLSREVIDLEENSYFRLNIIRLITSVCHMHGAVIRRCNLAHCDGLRNMVVAKLRGEDMEKKEEKGSDQKWKNQAPDRPKKFTSVALSLWVELMETYMTELDTDHLVYTSSAGYMAGGGGGGGGKLLISRYQIDVLRLYVAATSQLCGGVINTLQLVDDSLEPMQDDLVKSLSSVAERLQEKITRHTRMMEEIEEHRFGFNLTTYGASDHLPIAHPTADYRPILTASTSSAPPPLPSFWPIDNQSNFQLGHPFTQHH